MNAHVIPHGLHAALVHLLGEDTIRGVHELDLAGLVGASRCRRVTHAFASLQCLGATLYLACSSLREHVSFESKRGV